MDGDLFKYFVDQTNARLQGIEASLVDLRAFKIEMLASARTTSFIISAVCGAVTLVASCIVAYFTMRPHG